MLEAVHRSEWALIVASLARRFGSLDVAEEAAAEAFAAAVEHWRDGPPANPGGWLMTTATRRAIDRLRRDARGAEKYAEIAGVMSVDDRVSGLGAIDPDEEPAMDDDRLGLIFTCCHPVLVTEAQVALTLRLVGGLSVEQIARGLLKSEAAIGQRITRAKAKIAAEQVPYRVPTETDLAERVDAVLTCIYLIFNEGYLPGGEDPLAPALSDEALRLGRLLCELMPDNGEAVGLLALMLMTEARRRSRISIDGELVTLEDQDRGGWDRELIAQGHALIRARIATGQAPGRFQLQAAISAVHTHAREFRDTDWPQLGTLYAALVAVDPSPVVALNQAVVTAELDGPEVALARVDRLGLTGYHPWHATRAELLRRLGRSGESGAAYDAALALVANPAERRHLQRRRGSLAL